MPLGLLSPLLSEEVFKVFSQNRILSGCSRLPSRSLTFLFRVVMVIGEVFKALSQDRIQQRSFRGTEPLTYLLVEGVERGYGFFFFRTFPNLKKVRRPQPTRVRGCTPVSAHPCGLFMCVFSTGSWSSLVTGLAIGIAARRRHAGRWRIATCLACGCGLMAAMSVLGTGRSSRRLTTRDVVVGTSCNQAATSVSSWGLLRSSLCNDRCRSMVYV